MVVTAGLEDLVGNFPPRRRTCFRDRQMWEMVRQGRVVRYRMDYLLGSNFRIFRNMAVRDTRHNSDHFMAMG